MDIIELVKLTSKAWAIPILALMHAGTPGRQAALLSGTGAGRTALAQSLKHLIDLGMLQRTPGHGHPLRPEFQLTPKGARVAHVAARIVHQITDQDDGSLLRRSWTVPVLAVSQKPRFFGQIKQDLGRITDRALSQSLLMLQKRRWISRTVDLNMRPPRPIYQAVDAGARIAVALGNTR